MQVKAHGLEFEVGEIKLDRQGYTSRGRYYGVGPRLFSINVYKNGEEIAYGIELRARDMQAVKKLILSDQKWERGEDFAHQTLRELKPQPAR
jgi:hypothetical protein